MHHDPLGNFLTKLVGFILLAVIALGLVNKAVHGLIDTSPPAAGYEVKGYSDGVPLGYAASDSAYHQEAARAKLRAVVLHPEVARPEVRADLGKLTAFAGSGKPVPVWDKSKTAAELEAVPPPWWWDDDKPAPPAGRAPAAIPTIQPHQY